MSNDTLTAEANSWILDDPVAQAEKLRRERMRHFKLAKDLLLDKLGTETMDVLEVGGGPLPVSDTIRFRSRTVVDPLSDEYKKIAPCRDHIAGRAEDMKYTADFDLAIVTNSLDHVEDPKVAFAKIAKSLRRGGYAAIAGAEDNALTHPHEAHEHNLRADVVLDWAAEEFETVWKLTYAADGYRYGHVLYEGRRGQPAFALLLRKCTGY